MVDGGGATFSVVYFDGESETTVGEVNVDSSFNFNKLLSFLSHNIGVSPHQLSVYLASFGSNRKIPITAKFNFSAIFINTAGATASSFFLVKRSKRPKRNKVHSNKCSWTNDDNNNDNINNHTPANVVLLQRNAAVPFDFSPALSLIDYEKRMMDLEMQREIYLMSMRVGELCFERKTHVVAAYDGGGGESVICEECLKGIDGCFHRCVFDAVTFDFRSPAGPVARPVKGTE
ncbi:hypothetical protein TanjilG_19638 [Lupinus angustifolius]|uniref:DUF7138 domain-containing protein n=1 Tax=Lupinus angustifolius TaxID=3871 RepID=A0A1J7HEY8_LUPAN|nr:PREDICTED: uncharacterized protein LOC109348295 [Lupinus angustifolius]OIW11382.1 hypothetical protein TanjilG_19638 [Lupinus angustifolius]